MLADLEDPPGILHFYYPNGKTKTPIPPDSRCVDEFVTIDHYDDGDVLRLCSDLTENPLGQIISIRPTSGGHTIKVNAGGARFSFSIFLSKPTEAFPLSWYGEKRK